MPRRTEHVSTLNKWLVFMRTLCEKQSGEWTPICEMETTHQSVVCRNHSDVPAGPKPPPGQAWPLCGLFALTAFPDDTCSRQHADLTAHLGKMCSSHRKTLEKSVMGASTHKQTHTHTHKHLYYPALFGSSSHSWLGNIM